MVENSFEIAIFSHGPLAEGMKESLRFFYPDNLKITTIAIDEEGLTAFQKKMDVYFEKIKNQDVLIFTDLLYGTPFNEAGSRVGELNSSFEIIAGVNMPMLVEAVNYQRQEKALDDILPELMELGKAYSYREKALEVSDTDDE